MQDGGQLGIFSESQNSPRTGPQYGAAAKYAIASPRSSIFQISAMVPPARDKPELENTPQRNRETRSPPMFGDKAQGMLKMVYNAREMM